MFGQVKCISGSTILGSGEVALILDAPALIQQAVQHERTRLDSGTHATVATVSEYA